MLADISAAESALILTFHLGKGKDLWGSGTSRSLISMEAQKKIACATKEHGKRLFPVFSWNFPMSVLDMLFGNWRLGSGLWSCTEVPTCWCQTRAHTTPVWVSQLLLEVQNVLLFPALCLFSCIFVSCHYSADVVVRCSKWVGGCS